MAKEKKSKKSCNKKARIMIIYGIIQLGSRIVAAIALVSIALNFHEVKEESKIFNRCIKEVRENTRNEYSAVRL